MIGGPTVVVENIATVLMGNGQLTPVDPQGVISAAQRDIIDPAQRYSSTCESGLAHKEEVLVVGDDLLTERLIAEQVISQVGDGVWREQMRPLVQPALAGIALTILLVTPVLRGDHLGKAGQDMAHIRVHHQG